MHGRWDALLEECEISVLDDALGKRILNEANNFRGLLTGPRSLWSAGDTGRTTILTGRNHGEDSRQLRYCRGQARGEARRARLHQQALRTQICPATISRSRQRHLDPLLGWCTNCHGAQKGTLDRAETHINIRPALSFADSTANE